MNLTYEEALKELQGILAQLQEEQVSIDDLSQQVKRAAELIAYCRNKLRETEEDIGGLFES
jgi:exodeoxyribonuclease VII small subunit